MPQSLRHLQAKSSSTLRTTVYGKPWALRTTHGLHSRHRIEAGLMKGVPKIGRPRRGKPWIGSPSGGTDSGTGTISSGGSSEDLPHITVMFF